jgi:hypothetical protein
MGQPSWTLASTTYNCDKQGLLALGETQHLPNRHEALSSCTDHTAVIRSGSLFEAQARRSV